MNSRAATGISVLVALLLGSACGRPLTRYSANLSLLRHGSDEAYAAEPFRAPYIAVFRRDAKRLVYVSARHENEPGNGTFRTIKRAISEYRPQIVIIEGWSNGDISKQDFQRVLKCADEKFARCWEPAYAAFLAHRDAIPFAGAEPTDRQILDKLTRENYSIEDFLGFLFVIRIPQLRREGRLDKEHLEATVNTILRRDAENVGRKTRFGYPEFMKWWEAHKSPGQSLTELTFQDVGPFNGPDSTYFQRIGYAMDGFRETAIVRQIETMINRYDRVMVVYGGGHLVKQRKIWERMLGKSEDIKPF